MATGSQERSQREERLEVVRRAFAAVGAGDVEAQLASFTDDAVLEMPYADPPARLEGKDVIRARLVPALETFRFTLEITDVHECTDADTLILEYASDGRVTTTGRSYRNSYVGIFRFRDDLVCFQREYYNPVPAQKALAG
ncbi:MAG: nuclear transport factor 2 family protein [Actinomycetota bacterium]|nr:nuclear transport factor 2 family protein [Actinomycetota bacterium]